MEEIIASIIQKIIEQKTTSGSAQQNAAPLRDAQLQEILRGYMRKHHVRVSKRELLDFCLTQQHGATELWRETWQLSQDPSLASALLATLVKKPRRSASGVATITVITKPWPCSGQCIYCPNDIRMPKSYLHNEPACLRAELNHFDPFLQVSKRLLMLVRMGHPIDKIELIILGGTWSEYPLAYRLWFVRECLRALNMGASFFDYEGSAAGEYAQARAAQYTAAGFGRDTTSFQAYAALAQDKIDAGTLTYNQAVAKLWEAPAGLGARVRTWQTATWNELEHEQQINESASSRMVGLVFETRPDTVTASALADMRRMGATKLQMGIQSLDQHILDITHRNMSVNTIKRAFALARLFGFKLHIHAMVNLPGGNPTHDKEDFLQLVRNPSYLPDEIKLYPCALVGGTPLEAWYHKGLWAPYTQDELVDVLVCDVLATPAYTRISRMIRDFSTQDVLAGNDHPNLRQEVEERLQACASKVQEIRFREIATAATVGPLELKDVVYATSFTCEHFLQWVTQEGKIAGFLRLSLPHAEVGDVYPQLAEYGFSKHSAMIREVHVYGFATQLGEAGTSAQHQGLGKKLIAHAEELAHAAGYTKLKVISAVGTRNYYRNLGFYDEGLYLSKDL